MRVVIYVLQTDCSANSVSVNLFTYTVAIALGASVYYKIGITSVLMYIYISSLGIPNSEYAISAMRHIRGFGYPATIYKLQV